MAFYEVKNVYKNFGTVKVLKGIDLTLDEGQVLAIIGSSGSGKTTLLRCLNFLEIPDKADIYLKGEEIFSIDKLSAENSAQADDNDTPLSGECESVKYAQTSQDASQSIQAQESEGKSKRAKKVKPEKISKQMQKLIDSKRGHFGMVFQSFNLFPHFNVLKNVTLAAQLKYGASAPKGFKRWSKEEREKRAKAMAEIKEKAVALLNRVGLGEKLNSYPCELSGGQQQRVAIARALILQPDILCFDEPTSALDPELTREVLKVIRDLKKDGHTMIVVTHEMQFAKKVADKVIFMADGVVEEEGTPSQVFDNPVSEKTKAFLAESEKSIDEE